MADTAAPSKEKSAAAPETLKFVPKAGTNRVVICVPSEDAPIDIDAKGVEVEAGTPTALLLAEHPSLKQD
jgi:hypothetical protein